MKEPIEHQPLPMKGVDVIYLGGRIEGPELAWDLVQTFLAAAFSQAPRHVRRLRKVAALESQQG